MKKPKSEQQKMAEDIHDLKDRCRHLERVVRVIGGVFLREHLSEDQLETSAKRMHHLSNAMREVRDAAKRYGNEFDKQPYYFDPDQGE